MSSSNLVRLAYIPELVYGETPLTGSFKTARFTSEAFSGSPDTVESQQIRTDRMSSGQVVTGLKVGGDLNFELAKESALEDFMSAAMLDSWESVPVITTDLTIDATAKTLTRTTGSWVADGVAVGDFSKLGTFVSSKNNVRVMVAEIVSPTVLRIVAPKGILTETKAGATFTRADKLEIGVDKKSFTFEKNFLDLTEKAIIYRGMLAASMSLNVQFGSLINGTFSFSGNDYVTVDDENDFVTHSRTIVAPATTQTLNGSVDMPFLANGAIGQLDDSGLGIQQVNITLNNNLSPQNVIGSIAPLDYSPGTAAIEVSFNAYLKDAAWPLLAKKITQEAFALGFSVANLGGGYGFYMPQVQVSFDDPSSGGQNQDISLEMKGTAKVGIDGESSLVIYRF